MENLEKEKLSLRNIYLTRKYEDENLNYTDTQNTGKVLLLGNLTSELLTKYKALNNYTITQIRNMLETKNKYGENILLTIRNFGPSMIPSILDAIELYSSQVERQAKLTEERNINLFQVDKDKKLEIAEDLYPKIILYLIYNSNGKLFWGELSEKQKKLYMSSVINGKRLDKIIKSRMIEAIANYTTLPEMEKAAEGKMKVLNRFFEQNTL